MTLLAFNVGPVQFDRPEWLMLIPISWALVLWIGRSSLSGMGTTTRRTALLVRIIVVALIAGAIARPHWRREATNVTAFSVADASDSIPIAARSLPEQFVEDHRAEAERGDQIAWITTAEEAYYVMLPGRPGDEPDTTFYGARQGTDLAEAIRLSLAAMEDETANRIVLFTDGNETKGNLLSAARAAKAVGVPIDVVPIKYTYDREIVVDRLAVPATARKGENVTMRVLIDAQQPAEGRVSILVNGQALDLDPASDELGWPVRLAAGVNQIPIPITLPSTGPQQFEAVFEPADPTDDSIPENNRALGVTFVSAEGSVLVIAQDLEDAGEFMEAMRESKIDAKLDFPEGLPSNIVQLGAFDAVVLINTPGESFSQRQMEDLRAYVHDLGGGLVMIGGEDSFGAGGWLDTPVADALPIKLDPPQKRQMPRGALVLIMHSCEMPRGNYWGVQTGLAAVNNLSRLDLAGVIEYSWQNGGDLFIHPLSPVGNKAAIRRAINSLSFGDAPNFGTMMSLALNGSPSSPGLKNANAGAKHVIIISDGDPNPPLQSLLADYRKSKVTISTVAVFPHSGGGPNSPGITQMKYIADQTNGRAYAVTNNQQLTNLPNIFIKEARTIRRNMLWEGEPFNPVVVNATAAPMRGISAVPPISGYVVAAEREGLAQTILRGKEKDPILAIWQYGLGKSVAFTSTATSDWAKDWVAWQQYRAFWEQHVRWAMRPGGSADVRVFTEDSGEQTRVIIEALDPDGERLNFVQWRGRVVAPDGASDDVTLRQVGPGRYEGMIDSGNAGAYVLNLRYAASQGERRLDGAVQAAVTRPFANEFRSLKDNTALLTQVAELTGGRVIDPMTRSVNLWDREGLTMPVATRPIWLWIAVISLSLFLVDVAVKRVRIDVLAIVAAVRTGFGKTTQTADAEMSSLKEARERAQRGIAERSETGDTQAIGGADTASVKFEANADETATENLAIPTAGSDPAKPKQTRPVQETGEDDEEGMSRLLRAKRRARDQMNDDD